MKATATVTLAANSILITSLHGASLNKWRWVLFSLPFILMPMIIQLDRQHQKEAPTRVLIFVSMDICEYRYLFEIPKLRLKIVWFTMKFPICCFSCVSLALWCHSFGVRQPLLLYRDSRAINFLLNKYHIHRNLSTTRTRHQRKIGRVSELIIAHQKYILMGSTKRSSIHSFTQLLKKNWIR